MAIEHREDVQVIDEAGYQRRQRVVEHSPSLQSEFVTRFTQIVWLVTLVSEILIAFRVMFKLVVVNPNNGFANAIYSITGWMVAPFSTLLNNPTSESGAVLEITSLVAMLVYAVVAAIITTFTLIILKDNSSRSVKTIERT